MRYTIGRERTMENKPNGEEHSAAWHVLKDGRPFDPIDDHMFVVRDHGKQMMPEEQGEAQAQALADAWNAHHEVAEAHANADEYERQEAVKELVRMAYFHGYRHGWLEGSANRPLTNEQRDRDWDAWWQAGGVELVRMTL